MGRQVLYQLSHHTQLNSKWFKDLNVRPDSIILQEESIGRTISNINCSNIFFNLSARIMEIKTKILFFLKDLFKFKSFCITKKAINKTKDNPQVGRKYS